MELTTGTLLQTRRTETIILVTGAGDKWLTITPLSGDWQNGLDKVLRADVLRLIDNGIWRIVG